MAAATVVSPRMSPCGGRVGPCQDSDATGPPGPADEQVGPLLRRWVGPSSYWGQITADLKPICQAPTREVACPAFEDFGEKWGKHYPAISQLWRDA
jgi:hypothetical protein